MFLRLENNQIYGQLDRSIQCELLILQLEFKMSCKVINLTIILKIKTKMPRKSIYMSNLSN